MKEIKCPYRNFEDCLVEKCPSCNYKENKEEAIDGKYPVRMSTEEAIKRGMAWRTTKTTYEFVSCKLVESGVHPVPPKKETINNISKTSVIVQKSIF